MLQKYALNSFSADLLMQIRWCQNSSKIGAFCTVCHVCSIFNLLLFNQPAHHFSDIRTKRLDLWLPADRLIFILQQICYHVSETSLSWYDLVSTHLIISRKKYSNKLNKHLNLHSKEQVVDNIVSQGSHNQMPWRAQYVTRSCNGDYAGLFITKLQQIQYTSHIYKFYNPFIVMEYVQILKKFILFVPKKKITSYRLGMSK